MEGTQIKEPIEALSGYCRMSLDLAIEEAGALYRLGIRAVLLFVKVPEAKKDNTGTEALNENGLMQQSIRAFKKKVPELTVMTDVALDPYSTYGHDGIVQNGLIVNDESIEILAQMALSHAQSGADFIAPSDMMDGRVLAIRTLLCQNHYTNTGIMSYSAKYASCFYGPYRTALDSKPGFGDKKTYQMDISNRREAVREAIEDVKEGADIIMVKPALAYLDIIQTLRQKLNTPLAAYQVSGEYAMIKAAAKNGWVDEREAAIETLTAIKRSGADLIVSYFAKDFILWNENE